ncbi:MAG: type II toxin-antitoxin system HicA family toxin [Dehalococcoidia bacterium]
MSKLPVLSGEKCINALANAGFYFKRQEGSHVTLRRDQPFPQVVVPLHKELDRDTASYYSSGGILSKRIYQAARTVLTKRDGI